MAFITFAWRMEKGVLAASFSGPAWWEFQLGGNETHYDHVSHCFGSDSLLREERLQLSSRHGRVVVSRIINAEILVKHGDCGAN